jgi:hypothetical protein
VYEPKRRKSKESESEYTCFLSHMDMVFGLFMLLASMSKPNLTISAPLTLVCCHTYPPPMQIMFIEDCVRGANQRAD